MARTVGVGWRPFLMGAALVMATAMPAQAANSWAKVLSSGDGVQGLAAAPNGGVYIVTSPALATGTAFVASYTKAGTRSWVKTLGTDLQALGVVSDSAGNAYVNLYRSTPDADGYPYLVQQVRKNGSLGWNATWHDADASLTGDAIAIYGARIYVAQRDSATGETSIRRFAVADGTPAKTWTLTGSKGAAGRPLDIAVSSEGAFLMDNTAKLIALKTNGGFSWSKQMPGTAFNGGAMAIDSKGISLEYDAGNFTLKARRYSLDGTKRWEKGVPHGSTNAIAMTASGGNTYAANNEYTSDATRNQIWITKFSESGVRKGSFQVGTKNADVGNALLVSGDYIYVGGYIWSSPDKPLLIRAKHP